MKFFSSTWLRMPGSIQTSSKLRKWWLMNVRGYDLKREMVVPRRYRRGAMTYKVTWFLMPGEEKKTQ